MNHHLGVDTMRLWGVKNSLKHVLVFQNQANNQNC